MSDVLITKQEELDALIKSGSETILTIVQLGVQIDVLSSDALVIKSNEQADAIQRAMTTTRMQKDAQMKALRMIKARQVQLKKELGIEDFETKSGGLVMK